jgi:adenylate kinase family enzyme
MGTMGSGKTTLAKKLSDKLKIKNYDLDDIVWIKKFTKQRDKMLRIKKLKEIVDKKQWIMEGVHNEWNEYAFKKADLVIWLDLNPHYVVRNLVKRYLIGKVKRNERGDFKTQWDSVKYAINYRKGTKKYNFHKLMVEKYNFQLVHIKTRRQLNKFLEELR